MIPDLDKHIRGRLRVKRGDCLPFTGWDRTFTREELATLMAEASFTCGAEIGVRKGNYSRVLCERIPGLHLLCVDPYMPYAHRKADQSGMDALFAFAKNNLKEFKVTFDRRKSVEAAADTLNETLDFVYIDAPRL